jgi:hypothetical protein
MSLKLLPVDELWVDRIVALANVPWERATVEAMFVEWGLARSGEVVEWEGGPGAPQFAVDADGEPSGWSAQLGGGSAGSGHVGAPAVRAVLAGVRGGRAG